jgi:hypothetical protein
MSTTKKIYNLAEKVEILLTKYPTLRDDDKLLVTKLWDIELQRLNINPKTNTVSIFLSLYQQGKLSNAELIARARRKVQELNPELRGENWIERHKESINTRFTI